MKKNNICALLALCIFSSALFSQQGTMSQNWCGSIEAMEANFVKHPELRQRFNVSQAAANTLQNQAQGRTATVNYTIPVVFHVLHLNGTENISDAQIKDQISIFNRDYNLQNADTSVVINSFKNLLGNIHFTFALAKKDPNGNCTGGIDRFYDSNTTLWSGNSQDYIYTWDPTRYLNIYVVKSIGSGAAGYAYYPGSLSYGDVMDGIVILSDYVGSIGTSQVSHSRALTHEAGHWFDLQHTWGNTNNPGVACGDDQVGDTPDTQGYRNCPFEANSQICNPGVSENYQNYMDYSYCSVMFTPGQAARMTNAINSATSGRNNLWSTSNLSFTGISPVAPCAPVANFTANKQIVCINQPVIFSDQSNVGTPTSWNWAIQGATPNTASVQNPTVSYSTPGTYSVQLTSSNSVGSSSPTIKTAYISVIAAPVTSSLIEGFEGGPIPNATWSVKNLSSLSINWQQTNSAAATGIKSVRVSEGIDPSTTVELYSPSYDFSAMPGVILTLKWAGSEREASTASFDVFSVQFSTNCGTTWQSRLIRNIVAGNTGVSPSVSSGFVPSVSQFKTETVPLFGLTTETNIMFKLKFIAETGSSNNFYVDDINLTSATGIQEQQLVSNIQVFPNPATEKVSVEFDLIDNNVIEVELRDVLGRTVKQGIKEQMQSGHHTLSLPLSDISKGIYFVSIKTNASNVTKKLIVE